MAREILWRVKERRQRLQLPQAEAAARAGISHQRWHRLEMGYQQPRGDERTRMARALRSTVKQLWSAAP